MFRKFTWDQLNDSVVLPSRQLAEEVLKVRKSVNIYKDKSRKNKFKLMREKKLQMAHLKESSNDTQTSANPKSKRKTQPKEINSEPIEDSNLPRRSYNKEFLSKIFTS